MLHNPITKGNGLRKSKAVSGDNNSGRVWDLPLRLFHWALAVAFGAAWATSTDRYLDVHVFAGTAAAGLLLFRLFWGLLGEPNARFRDFRFGWKAFGRYLRDLIKRRPRRFVGHNPAGSWAIWLMLLLLLSIVVTGALTLGGEERHGLFAGWLGFVAGAALHRVHETLAWVMAGLVVVHLLGVLVESLLHRENLVASLLTGNKRLSEGFVPVRRRGGVALFLSSVLLLLAAWWFQGYLHQTPERPYLPMVGPALPADPVLREECGGCHLAYHPSLLPARSWTRMMALQADHFGEDLALTQEDAESILGFQMANSAERASTEAAWKINRSISADQAPLRITETGYWKRKHREIESVVWDGSAVNGRWNCDACHLDAAQGTFEDGAMILPD